MIVWHGGKGITLEELAKKLCAEISGKDADGCYNGSCPAADYCTYRNNGMLQLLRKVLKYDNK